MGLLTPDVVSITAAGTANRRAFAADSAAQVMFLVSGTWTGALQVQGSNDGVHWDNLPVIEPMIGLRDPTITFNGHFVVILGGYDQVGIYASTFSSGQADILAAPCPSAYGFIENYAGVFSSETARTTSGTKSTTITNYVSRGVGLALGVTAVTGTIPWPQINVFWLPPGSDVHQIATWTPTGNISVTNKPVLLMYPGAGPGAWDGVIPIPVPRVTRWDLVWTLPGGASVSYTEDYAFFL